MKGEGMNRRDFLKRAGAAIAAVPLGASSEQVAADIRPELPNGETVPALELTEPQRRAVEETFDAASKAGPDSFESFETDTAATDLDDATTPEHIALYASMVSGFVSGALKYQHADVLDAAKEAGVVKWKPIPVADKSVRTIGVAHIERTLRKSLRPLLEEIKSADVVILESIGGGELLKKTFDALQADPSVLEYPETFEAWRKRTGTKGFFDFLACAALAHDKRVFVIDPVGDAVGTYMFLAETGLMLGGIMALTNNTVPIQGSSGLPLLLTICSRIKHTGEIGGETASKMLSKRMREHSPQQFARLIWDINDWRDIHAAQDTRALLEGDALLPGDRAVVIRGAAHGASLNRYLSEPKEAFTKR